MDINDLKSTWRNSGNERKGMAQLQAMTQMKNHPQIRQIRMKFLVQVPLLVIFLAFYYDMFDGHTKSLFVNIALIVSCILYIVNDVLGYFILINPVRGTNISLSLKQLENSLKTMLFTSVSTSLLFGGTLILFMVYDIVLTPIKYLLLSGMVLTLIVFVYVSRKNWLKKIGAIKRASLEFEEIM